MTVPLIVVTGFLGAGKTTLVNQLLARRAARGATDKLGVIVNELGAVGIDGDLLAGDATRQVELPGGCVCCVLGDELGTTLLELVERNPGLAAIVLETTGVAEPLPIAWAVAKQPVADHVRLAAVVTLVDAGNFFASREVSASVEAQVAYADVLVLTKEAQVAAEDATRVAGAAVHLAPRALVRHGTTAEHAAWLESVLADPPLDTPASLAESSSSLNGQAEAVVSHHVHTDECRHLDSHGAHGIDSVWTAVAGAVDLEELCDQLADLPANYVRIKGIVRDAARGWYVVHRVGPRVSSEPFRPTRADGQRPEPEQGRIVALGPHVSSAAIARCVEVAST